MEDDTRISVVGIIIEDRSSAEQVNELLHQYGDYIIDVYKRQRWCWSSGFWPVITGGTCHGRCMGKNKVVTLP